VRVDTTGPRVSIAVHDSGPGVPESFRPRQGGSFTYAPRDPQDSIFTLTLPVARQV